MKKAAAEKKPKPPTEHTLKEKLELERRRASPKDGAVAQTSTGERSSRGAEKIS